MVSQFFVKALNFVFELIREIRARLHHILPNHSETSQIIFELVLDGFISDGDKILRHIKHSIVFILHFLVGVFLLLAINELKRILFFFSLASKNQPPLFHLFQNGQFKFKVLYMEELAVLVISQAL